MIHGPRLAGVAISWLIFAGAPEPACAAAGEEPVAIVCLLSGTGFATVDGTRTQLQLFQRLKAGTVVATEDVSKVVLALFTGDRYELGAMSMATLKRTELDLTSGTVRQLEPVPSIVEIAPIAKEERSGTRLAGTRIRTGASVGHPIAHMYPSMGATAVVGRAVVRFDPEPGYNKYRIELEDEKSQSLFAIETGSTKVTLPPDVLLPESTYYWTVRTLDRQKPVIRGEALFRTLKQDDVRRRAAFKAQVDQLGDGSLLTLLAELDRSLGLRQEACDALSAALERGAEPGSIDAARARFECSTK